MIVTEKRLWPLMILTGIYTGILVAANASGAKIIFVGDLGFGPLAASATVFAYAISFVITDIVSEFYGKKTARTVVWAGFLAVLLGASFFQAAIVLRPAPFFEHQAAYETVFGTSFRIFLGGIIAYLISQHIDVYLFHFFKVHFRNKHLWLRNNLSTLISQAIDTVIFITIAFYGVFPGLFELILGQYFIKIIIAILDTPLIYAARFGFSNFLGWNDNESH